MPDKVKANLTKATTSLVLQLEARVKRKLSGQVLKVRTGNLRDSISHDVTSTDDSVVGRVYSSKNVKYGAIHEFGGKTSPHVIVPKNAQALAFQSGGKTVFASRVNHPGSNIPARPFMRPSLAEMKDKIIERMNQAVTDGLK
ncbi:MAG: phage virion morphogenesis protein [Rhodospirillales bacterium]|nr:phage virion morphogenesis protein [Rhodospirillales bacterium]